MGRISSSLQPPKEQQVCPIYTQRDDKTDPEGDSVAWGGGSLKVLWLHGGFVLGATSSQPLERQPWCRRGLGAARGPCHPSPNPSTPRLALASGLVL